MESDFVKLREIKPALSGYITRSQKMLAVSGFPDEETVHDVRVLMKKARAALKMTTPHLDTQFADKEIKSLREVGRKLKVLRELTVFRKTLKSIRQKYPDIFLDLADNQKINEIISKPVNDDSVDPSSIKVIDEAQEILEKTAYLIRFEQTRNIDPQLLLKELEKTYNRVVNNYIVCRINAGVKNLHEFRKSSKDFLYQLWFFRPLNQSVIKSVEKKLDGMTQCLGKYNDLAHLLKEIGYDYELSRNNPALDELAIIIKSEQDKYLLKVWPVAFKIFCPGSKLVNILGFKLLII